MYDSEQNVLSRK